VAKRTDVALIGYHVAMTWRVINIWMENVTEVPKWFLLLNLGTTYETNENSSIKFKKAKKSGTNNVFNPIF
jgi:hypothetical protein